MTHYSSISVCLKELETLHKRLARGGPGKITALTTAAQYLKELKERRSEICARCRYYEHGYGCQLAEGLLNAKDGDYCSRWSGKPMHEMREV